jgi:CheY-like chemotaxis protein
MRVLIVEDEASVNEFIGAVLVKGGFRPEVTSAFNGDEALRIYREQGPFDLVLSDLFHPGMNGCSLLEAVTRINSRQRFGFVTGQPVLNKPFKAQELIDFVKGLE